MNTQKTENSLLEILRKDELKEYLLQTMETPTSKYRSWRDALCYQEVYFAVIRSSLSIAAMFDAYPMIKSIQPRWEPILDAIDSDFIVRFSLKIETDKTGSKVYTYDDEPEEFEDLQCFQDAIEMGESVGPEIWNEFLAMDLAEKPTFENKGEVLAILDADEGAKELLAKIKAWALTRTADKCQEHQPKNPAMKSKF